MQWRNFTRLFYSVIMTYMLNEEFYERLKTCYPADKEGLDAYESELPIAKEALVAIESEISSIYKILEPIDIGGASIVVKVGHNKTGIDYALKLPRPRGQDYLDTVKQEMQHLIKIRHENIITIHYMDEVPVSGDSYPFFIMDYIHNAIDLRKCLENIVKKAKHSSDVFQITIWLAERLYNIARALELLHQLEIIHFDVKPGNIFVDTNLNDRAVLADLGYAKSRTESDEAVVVGFTLFYAHTDLAEHYYKASSRNRVTKPMIPRNFRYAWDIYALGKSILELLALIDRSFPDTVGYDATFSYLHLAACRMLDGLNFNKEETLRLREQQSKDDPASYWETWQALTRREFSEDGIRYKEMSQVVNDLRKLNNSSAINRYVPELNAYISHTIHISEDSPSPFTPRVKKLVEHPTFSRLGEVLQLGLIKLIYPPATHTRLDHSIGTLRNACQYIQALYNDPYNPLFRQFVNSEDLKIILIVSLLHDLGHFPLAHELEDVSEIFHHSQITLKFLDNTATDPDGHTIKEIIENSEWGWGIPIGLVKEVLTPEKQDQLISTKNLKTRLLSSIIDGPIDVDKTDYLIRDSYECRLPYGRLIDYNRLVRNLTIILTKDSRGYCDPQLGVYEKGQPAAESLTFARYLLYQALYWHHSARAIRVMLRQVAAEALRTKDSKKKSFKDDFSVLLGINSTAQKITTEDILTLMSKWTDDSGQEIIGLLRNRKFYKRILTIHDERLPDDLGESTWEKLQRVRDRSKLQEELHDAIQREFANFISSGSYSNVSLLAEDKTNSTMAILQKDNSILIDIPEPSYGTEKSLKIIPEPQRLQRNYLTRIDTGQRISEVWAQVHHKLMRISAKSRVFCHPDARDTLMAALGPEDIKNLLDGIIDNHTKTRA